MPRRLLWLLPIALGAVVLVWHAQLFGFVTDDAYISFVYSRNLAEHGELSFNLGDPVEGYTNFLWTFVLGVLMKLGADPAPTSLVLGAACAIGTLVVTWRLMRRVLAGDSVWAVLPALLLACSSGFACWTSGGLETQLFTLLVTAAIERYVAATATDARPLRAMGVLLALAAMTRPEGLLVTALIGLHRLVLNLALERRLRPHCGELWALGAFLAVWAPWFAWRWRTYGWPFPNTYYVKAHGPWSPPALGEQMWSHGAFYLKQWLTQTRLIYMALPALVGLLAARPRTPRFVLTTFAALFLGVYAVYTASVGGDFMGLHRFIMPMFVVAAVVVVLGVQWLAEYAPAPASWALAALLLGGFAFTQAGLTRSSLRDFPDPEAQRHGIDTPRFLIDYTEDRAAIGRAMAPCFVPTDLSIVGGAGAQPWFGRMRAYDVFGLVSERIAHEEPRTRARAGHTKFARERLLADYDPTFVFSCYQLSPRPSPGPQGCESFWKSRGYERVSLEVPGLRERVNRSIARGAKTPDEPDRYYTFLVKRDRQFACPGLVR